MTAEEFKILAKELLKSKYTNIIDREGFLFDQISDKDAAIELYREAILCIFCNSDPLILFNDTTIELLYDMIDRSKNIKSIDYYKFLDDQITQELSWLETEYKDGRCNISESSYNDLVNAIKLLQDPNTDDNKRQESIHTIKSSGVYNMEPFDYRRIYIHNSKRRS